MARLIVAPSLAELCALSIYSNLLVLEAEREYNLTTSSLLIQPSMGEVIKNRGTSILGMYLMGSNYLISKQCYYFILLLI